MRNPLSNAIGPPEPVPRDGSLHNSMHPGKHAPGHHRPPPWLLPEPWPRLQWSDQAFGPCRNRGARRGMDSRAISGQHSGLKFELAYRPKSISIFCV